MEWRKFNGDPLESPIFESVEKAIQRETDKGYRLKVCIGTDSQVKGKETEFATVIVFLREGQGGFMFISNEKTRQTFTIKERMLTEVSKSIEIAYQLCPLFNQYDVDMEVHADINTNPQFKIMMPYGRQWDIFWEWVLPLKQSRRHLPVPVAPIK
jgi:predicted RNase H-related nuclease YkuK (DUF458 family)